MKNTPQESFVAIASACTYDTDEANNNRPITGVIQFNTNFLNTSNVFLQDNLYTLIHEMTHVLGFSSNLYT